MTQEELQEQLLQAQEKNKELEAEFTNIKAEKDKLVEDNKRLTEYNNKLFMRIGTEEPAKDPKKELTEEEEQELENEEIMKLIKGIN